MMANTGIERLNILQELGWKVVADDRKDGIGEVRLERTVLRKDADPFGNPTDDDIDWNRWKRLERCQIFFYDDGTFEETIV